MADFKPFQAWRYQPSKIRLDDVIAPPYDVISPTAQEKLYRRSPQNCVRLILNQEKNTDHESDNRYTRSRDFLETWCREGVLVKDEEPSFYLYEQVFIDPRDGREKRRMSLLGRIKLEPFERDIIIPHEKTLAKPRADRARLLETTHTNFSPVFGLYEDPEGKTRLLYEEVRRGSPAVEAKDDEGAQHRLWQVSRRDLIESLRELFRSKKIYIADGHHRYQTALEHALRERKRFSTEDERPSDFVLMALVEFHDPGLVLLPTHRLMTSLPEASDAKLVDALRPFFKIDPLSKEEIFKRLETKDAGKSPQFGLFFEKEQFLLTLGDLSKAKTKMPAGKPSVWYDLDVNVLGHLILASLWQLAEPEWENYLRFTQSSEEAVSAVRQKTVRASLLLRALRPEVLREMGEVRELMPQKSTYFYPKLASGLVFYRHTA